MNAHLDQCATARHGPQPPPTFVVVSRCTVNVSGYAGGV